MQTSNTPRRGANHWISSRERVVAGQGIADTNHLRSAEHRQKPWHNGQQLEQRQQCANGVGGKR